MPKKILYMETVKKFFGNFKLNLLHDFALKYD